MANGATAVFGHSTAQGTAARFKNDDYFTEASFANANAAELRGTVSIVGDVFIIGSVSKSSGSFRIDHPLDPANRYLSHSFVESPDMMNVYNGNVVTDMAGFATIDLPEYFEALNGDFRYQLTVIDDGEDFALAKVVREIEANRFTIRTSAPRTKVSWQVTGIRHDAHAVRHPIVVEADKPAAERGLYVDPLAFGLPLERGIGWRRMDEADAATSGEKRVAGRVTGDAP